ncbi:MAG: HIT domain-containing protein, partial [Pseudomonadota bacterium]
APQAPVHVLVIPKGPYVSLDHMCLEASDAEITGFMRAVGKVCEMLDVEDGFRTIANTRENGMQEVPHLHFHILGGKPMGPLLAG